MGKEKRRDWRWEYSKEEIQRNFRKKNERKGNEIQFSRQSPYICIKYDSSVTLKFASLMSNDNGKNRTLCDRETHPLY